MLDFILFFLAGYFCCSLLKLPLNRDIKKNFYNLFIILFSFLFFIFLLFLSGCKSFSLHHDLEYKIENSVSNPTDVSES